MTKKTPAAVETTASAPSSAILANRAARRKAGKSCYIRVKPKGPVLENTIGNAVATPTDKRGFVMSEFVRYGVSRCGLVLGKMGLSARLAARRYPCFQHLAHPLRLKTRLVASESRNGAKTMTKAVNLVRPAAPIITLASRRAAPIQSALDTTDRDTIALHIQAVNALSMALSMLRNPAGTVADLERATARACRAATLLKRACSAAQEGGAA